MEMDSIDSSFSIESKLKLVVNDPKFSDVVFEVGNDKHQVYGHKLMLSMASEVFKSMFFGDVKGKPEKIQIPDLTPTGFINLLKYVYGGKKIDFELSEIFETYKAAEKYLVDDLKVDLTKYMLKNLKPSNCLQIYEQIISNQLDKVKILYIVENYIIFNCKKAFDSDSLCQINESTLSKVLKLAYLAISEIDLLRNCLRWVEAELTRLKWISNPRNKQKIFKNIKKLINFGIIPLEKMKGIKGLEDLLTDKEKATILSYYFTNQKIAINDDVKRFSISINSNDLAVKTTSEVDVALNLVTFVLTSNYYLFIDRINTTFDKSIEILEFSIYFNQEKKDLFYTAHLNNVKKWCLEFNRGTLSINKLQEYKFEFKIELKAGSRCRLHKNAKLEIRDTRYTIEIKSDYHCIDKLQTSFLSKVI